MARRNTVANSDRAMLQNDEVDRIVERTGSIEGTSFGAISANHFAPTLRVPRTVVE